MQKAAQEILGSIGNFPAITNKYWRSSRSFDTVCPIAIS